VIRDGVVDREEVLLLLASVPERVSDLVSGLQEPYLDYRHAPAFPTVKEVVAHLCAAGQATDSLLRQSYVDGQRELSLRAALEPEAEADLTPPARELLEGYGRVRRRTVDLLRGLGAKAWEGTIVDPERGEMTLLAVCEAIARHEVGHLSQMRNLIALLPRD
jgi:hypothetical protein